MILQIEKSANYHSIFRTSFCDNAGGQPSTKGKCSVHDTERNISVDMYRWIIFFDAHCDGFLNST